ncbi:CAP domain-containing protein [Candidatus Peregrinibacteria bacterium]|nr:CAP domain-containing protein [Candidatus Peregrinibacteria bacterium]MBI3815942.1 CAP domain-containing protein [Candidatus Peregrinibacteria bacterium]
MFALTLLPSSVLAKQPSSPFATRAEAALILLQARMHDVPKMKNNGRYPDIKHGAWYENSMLTAIMFGIVTPHPGTHAAHPEEAVTRAEFLVMLQRTFGLKEMLPAPYRDVPQTAWYAPDAWIAQSLRLFPLDNDPDLLHPGDGLGRVELTLLMRAFFDLPSSSIPGNDQALSQLQSNYRLHLYQTISTKREEETRFPLPVLMMTFPERPIRHPTPSLSPTVVVPLGPDPKLTQLLRKDMIDLTNAKRKEAHVRLVAENPQLDAAAQQYADDMAVRGFFSHINPEGQTFVDRMKASNFSKPLPQGPCGCIVKYAFGENLSHGPILPEDAIDAWMSSASHRAALLDRTYTDVGVGIHGDYWVEHFGGLILSQ